MIESGCGGARRACRSGIARSTIPGTTARRTSGWRRRNWGSTWRTRPRSKGIILTSEQFHALFVAAYPDLIAPDAI